MNRMKTDQFDILLILSKPVFVNTSPAWAKSHYRPTHSAAAIMLPGSVGGEIRTAPIQ
ncbi:hypothetical protein GobsT_45960 [Gemmata obscuriglobus]|nr:hypothetical protein GobsT_45960 [Gemmata obscuriglobus]VTS09115.1 unnamed protein product [Gemmata obscuriglobus UQM 2246]